MPRFKIHHTTRYLYEEPVRDSANQITLYPIKDEFQDVVHHHIAITSNPQVAVFTDYFGNEVGTFTHAQPHRELVIESRLEVVTRSRKPGVNNLSAEEQWKILERLKFQFQFIDFLKTEPFSHLSEAEEIIRAERQPGSTPLDVTRHFASYLFQRLKYQKGITTVETTLDEIWKLQSGVCQDFAHVLLYFLRMMQIPARYVSGYVCPNKTGMRGEGATHAWVEAYIPGQGWLGVDPTNNCLVDDAHVKLATGKNFTDCSPVKGTYRGTSRHTLEVTVSVHYEDGNSVKNFNEVMEAPVEPVKSFSRNSFRKFQEMQMQQ